MKNKSIIAFMLVVILLTIGISPAFAIEEVEYREWLERSVFKVNRTGEFAQPTSSFQVNTSTGEKIQAGPSPFLEADAFHAGQTMGDLPIKGTFPVGTTFQAVSNSQLGAGTAFSEYDWQLYVYDKNFNIVSQNIKNHSTSKVSDKVTATKEGYVGIFLNSADNHVARNSRGQNLNHRNWSKTGNWLNYNPNGTISAGMKLSGWYFEGIMFKIGGQSEMILKELELVDPVTNTVLESFKRNIDPLDPFNKQSITATHSSIKNATVLQRNKDYKIRAKYQYIDFSEGSFDIRGAMTPEQKALKTGVTPNKLDVKYAYDIKTGQQGQYDASGISTSSANELKNLEIAPFEWTYRVPNDKKAVKIAGFVPNTFPKSKNATTKDDYGVLYAMVESADLALNEPLVLKVDGKTTTKPIPGKTHTVTVNAEHLLGKIPVGLNHNGKATGNDRFTILVSAREGSASGNYLKKEEKEKNT